MADLTPPSVELDELVSLFYQDAAELGTLSRADQTCPSAYADLLAHEAHMTVTVEKRHGCPVSVEVLESRCTDAHYLRKILLRRTSDNRVVQFGIVRLALDALQPAVRNEIMAQNIPLGRVLIQHNVFRKVHLSAVWKVTSGSQLCKYLACELGHTTYGRTALIYCDGEPAVELLEILAPEENF
ncbi:MAG: hypothetical protein AAF483_21415 [Planctomycetota bacterium]